MTDAPHFPTLPDGEAPFLDLQPHPERPAPVGLQVAARARILDHGDWQFEYRIQGVIQGLKIPAAAAAGPADGLWQHTCFEAFLGPAGQGGYVEFNFSPSGQWARYAFSAERVRDPEAEEALAAPAGISRIGRPRVQCRHENHGFLLWATVPAALVPARPLQVGLTTVVESTDGALSYWALHHPRPQPDFHHADGRCLRAAEL